MKSRGVTHDQNIFHFIVFIGVGGTACPRGPKPEPILTVHQYTSGGYHFDWDVGVHDPRKPAFAKFLRSLEGKVKLGWKWADDTIKARAERGQSANTREGSKPPERDLVVAKAWWTGSATCEFVWNKSAIVSAGDVAAIYKYVEGVHTRFCWIFCSL